MKQEILSQFPWPWLPATAMLIFFAFFVGQIISVSLKSRRHVYSAAQQLPLEDGKQQESHHESI